MIRRLLPCVLLFPVAACADPEPPRADPARVERLMARLDAQPSLPPGVAKKVEKADRLSGAVLKIAPEKIDPDVAAALIVR